MQTGEDMQGLRKIIDFTRLISVFILAIHFYLCYYQAFRHWHWTAGITDRIIGNIAKTGLFSDMLRPKLAALLALAISLVGVKGRKDEKIRQQTIAVYVLTGLLIYLSSVLCFYLKVGVDGIAVAYRVLTVIGYLLMLTGGTYLSRLIKNSLNNDIFNTMQETV